jgi:hypothetical protein
MKTKISYDDIAISALFFTAPIGKALLPGFPGHLAARYNNTLVANLVWASAPTRLWIGNKATFSNSDLGEYYAN